jgi:hypothetical protein
MCVVVVAPLVLALEADVLVLGSHLLKKIFLGPFYRQSLNFSSPSLIIAIAIFMVPFWR